MTKECVQKAQEHLKKVEETAKTDEKLKDEYRALKRSLEMRKKDGLTDEELALFQKQVDEVLKLRLEHTELTQENSEMVLETDNFRRIAERLKKKLNLDRTVDEIREALIRKNVERLKRISPTGTRLTYGEAIKDQKRLARLSEEFKKEIILHIGDIIIIPEELLAVERTDTVYTVDKEDTRKMKGKSRARQIKMLAERIKTAQPDATYGLSIDDLARDLERQIPKDKKIEEGTVVQIPESGRLMQRQAERAREAASSGVGISVEQAEERISAPRVQQAARSIERGEKVAGTRVEAGEAQRQARAIESTATSMVQQLLAGSGKFKRMAKIAKNISLDANDLREIFGITLHTREGLIGLVATGDDAQDLERFKNQYHPRTIDDDTIQAFVSAHGDKPDEIVDFLADTGTASMIGTMLTSVVATAAAASPALSVVLIGKLGEIDIGIRTGHFETIRERDLQFLAELVRITDELKKHPKGSKEYEAAKQELERLVNWGNRERYKELTTAIEKREKLRSAGRMDESHYYDQAIARLIDKKGDAHEFIELSKKLYESEKAGRAEDVRKYDGMIRSLIEKYRGKEKTVGPVQEPDPTLILQHILHSERFQEKLKTELAKGGAMVAALAEGGFSPEERAILRELDIDEKQLQTAVQQEEVVIEEGQKFKRKKAEELGREYKGPLARIPILSIFTREGRTRDFETELAQAREKAKKELADYEKKHRPEIDAYLAIDLEALAYKGDFETIEKKTKQILTNLLEMNETNWDRIDPDVREEAEKTIRELRQTVIDYRQWKKQHPDPNEVIEMHDAKTGTRRIKVSEMTESIQKTIRYGVTTLRALAARQYHDNPLKIRLQRYDELETQVKARDHITDTARTQVELLTQAIAFDDAVEKIRSGKEIPAEKLQQIQTVGDLLHEMGTALPAHLDMVDIEGMIQNGTLHPQTRSLFQSIQKEQQEATKEAEQAMNLVMQSVSTGKDITIEFQKIMEKLQKRQEKIKKAAQRIQELNGRSPEQIQIAWNEERFRSLMRRLDALTAEDTSKMNEEDRAKHMEKLRKAEAAIRAHKAIVKSLGDESLHIPIDPDMFETGAEAKAFADLTQELAQENAFQSWEAFQTAMKKRGVTLKVWRTPATTGRFAMFATPQEITLEGGKKITIRQQLLNTLQLFLPSRTDKERPGEKPPLLVTMQRALARVGIYVSYGELLDAIAKSKHLTKEELQKKYGSTINTGVSYFPEEGGNINFPIENGQEISLERAIFLPQTAEEKGKGIQRKLKITYNIVFREECFNVNIPNENLLMAEILKTEGLVTPEERRMLETGEIPFVSFIPKLVPLYGGWQVARLGGKKPTTETPEPGERITETGGGGPATPPSAPKGPAPSGGPEGAGI